MAKTAAKGKGSNLFSLDHDAIRAVLADANAALLSRAENLAAAMERMPALLDTDELVERARTFQAQILGTAKELRQARLNDGKPFREADGAVKAFFAITEARLGTVGQEVRRRLTDAALRAQRREDAGSGSCVPMAADPDGQDLGQASLSSRPGSALPGAAASIPLRWEVVQLDRMSLDLEALRMFLTDAALLAACRKHLEEKGPHVLDGATYRQVAAG